MERSFNGRLSLQSWLVGRTGRRENNKTATSVSGSLSSAIVINFGIFWTREEKLPPTTSSSYSCSLLRSTSEVIGNSLQLKRLPSCRVFLSLPIHVRVTVLVFIGVSSAVGKDMRYFAKLQSLGKA